MGRVSSLLIVASLAAAACQRAPVAPAPPAATSAQPLVAPAPSPTGRPPALIADARLERKAIRAYEHPWSDEPMARFPNPNDHGYREVFLVDTVRPGWLRVYLPMRPNGSTGWVRRADVEVRRSTLRVVVDLSSNRLSVWDGDELVMREAVATGTGGTPTPTGLFYPRMLAKTSPSSAYGPYIFALSAYSEVLFSFAGGDGMVGIHGTNDPSSIGRDVSHGCIRMRNAAISRLARLLPLGAPVRIRA
ncbi:MAG: L,D-transpeptidase [Actinomycetota bacterium]